MRAMLALWRTARAAREEADRAERELEAHIDRSRRSLGAPSPAPADPMPGVPPEHATYSFPEIPVVERRIRRCSHLVRVLATADVPVLREELHARLAEGDPTIAEAIRALPRDPTP